MPVTTDLLGGHVGERWCLEMDEMYRSQLAEVDADLRLVLVPGYESTISDENHANPNCTACASGKAKTNKFEFKCSNCSAGTYSKADGATYCATCGAGKFSRAVGAKSETSCQVCSAGKASGAIDADTEMACVRCPPGFFAGTGSAACMPCPVGDYSEFIGSSDCSSCATGFTTNGTGAKLAGECIPKPVFNTTMPIMTTPSPVVTITLTFNFNVEPSEILAKKAQYELAIANAGGVNGKSFARGNVCLCPIRVVPLQHLARTYSVT